MSVQPAVQLQVGEKVPAMGSGATNYQYRKVLNRESADAMKVIYDVPKAGYEPGCCQKICSCSCCQCCKCCTCDIDCTKDVRMAMQESRYTWVMENRMEFNTAPFIAPKNQLCSVLCCKYEVQDFISVKYFDNDMFDYITVKKPCGCVRWCCGSYGDEIVFKTACCCCPSAKYCGVKRAGIYVKTGEGGNISQTIKTARDSARAKMG